MASVISGKNIVPQIEIPQYPQVIKKLKLQDYYPKKLTREMALAVSKNDISTDDLKDPGKIPWFILQNLITCNYEGRCFKLKKNHGNKNQFTFLPNSSDTKIHCDNTEHISPIDAMIALFWCCDDFVRQILVNKMAMCQLAVPLLLPLSENPIKSECLLWAIRTLKKEWKTKSGTSCEALLATYPLPIISAIRLGRPQTSKSAMLNKVISDLEHDIFFNRECNGGSAKRHISDGLLEMSWYLPNENEESFFSEALIFMNLRGDASQLKAQTAFISEISLTTIVFLASDLKEQYALLLKTFYKQNRHLCFVVDEEPKRDSEKKGMKIEWLSFLEKSESDICEHIRQFLNGILQGDRCKTIPEYSIEMLVKLKEDMNFHIDEEKMECSEAKIEAEKMFKSLKPISKQKQFPLQTISKEIGEKCKEQYQLKYKGEIEEEEYREQIISDIKALRFNQKEIWDNDKGIAELFKSSLTYSSLKRNFFYIYVKIITDKISTEALKDIRLEYIRKWNEFCEDQQTNQDSDISKLQSMKNRNELDDLESQLNDLSIGLEHIVREFGQVYEMESSHLEVLPNSMSQIPEIAAEMLLNGHPLELMDGDAFYVPLIWIEAVLNSLKNKIGDKRIFVLSVLGIQSSGKSTMLNAMFGLQFHTSAGRCTKGVFAQLLPLATPLQQSTGYEYIMVVDAEGLHAAELVSTRSNNRDNELATLVIGVSDATIINVMGENATDLLNILQITVHAFMKMKNVNINPSCLFVHQNITDVSASDKTTTQKRNILEVLDKLTKVAAEVEGCSDKYQRFTDVIEFQGNQHLMNVSCLWKGDPPMAPPNPSYSRDVTEVKHQVFKLMEKSHSKTVEHFKCRLSDLWKAILCEKCLFGFKNTIEIQAYKALEKKYVEYSGNLTKATAIYIENLEKQCKNVAANEMEETGKRIFDDQFHNLEESINEFNKSMKAYFSREHVPLQWKNETELKGKKLCEGKKEELKGKFMLIKWENKEKADIANKCKIASDISEYPKVITKLKLQDYYPKKITRESALAVSKNYNSADDLKDPGKIPWFILQNLITCNYEGRCFKVKQNHGFQNRFSFPNPTDTTNHGNNTEHISPSDAMIALFWCCDDFVRQILVTKLAMCQLAIPLLLPLSENPIKSECLLWAIRTLKKEWKKPSGSSCEALLATYPLPIISAIRVGRPRISKSAILNKVMSDLKHDIFFNVECNGGALTRHISDGLLEMSWYFPNEKGKRLFSEALLFLNLRGDASQLNAQTSFISQISLTTIVFMASDLKEKDALLLETFYQQNGHLYFVLDGKPGIDLKNVLMSLERNRKKDMIIGSLSSFTKSKSEICEEIRHFLNVILQEDRCKAKPDKSIEMLVKPKEDMNFHIDEETTECSEAKIEAEKMFKSLKPIGKQKQFPLQTVSKEIGEKCKEQYRLKYKEEIEEEEYREQIISDIQTLRVNQREIWDNDKGIVELFKNSLTYSSLKRNFFYIYVKIITDQISTQALQDTRPKYIRKWNELCKGLQENENGNISKIESMKNELDDLERELDDLSIGLEHIVREFGQVYEMESSHFEVLPNSVSQLPVIAAEMLLNGHPLELMDGDAFYVPLIWIEAVLSSLQKQIGNKRIFVLSVLGIQSSGKSTMLNAMFGLQFATSAARCTKGVFAQLLPLATPLQQSTGYEYIMVVDAEGVRAAELVSTKSNSRDNELATLVIGLGDVTIINIMGENATEMHDILQITVHAFMKMKNVNINPRCIFVHQNVTDISASDKNTTQKRKIREMLDSLTKAAAEEEGCCDKYQKFSDVIQFQENKHTMYVPCLWKGDPPMAPPNPSYSRAIVRVKHQIFELMEMSYGKTVEHFMCRLSDLWKAILCEKFLFGFKNTIEIQAYNALETKYVEYSRKLTRNTATCIENLEKQCKIIAANEMEETGKFIFDDLVNKLDESINDFNKSMQDYFSREQEALQWKNRTESMWKKLCEEKKKELKGKFMLIKKEKKERAGIANGPIQYKLLQKAKGLAKDLFHLNLTNDELRSRFEKQWQEWASDVLQSDLNVNINSVSWKFKKKILCDMFIVECKSSDLSVKAALLVSEELKGAISKCLNDQCIKEVIESFSNSITGNTSFSNKMAFHAQLLIALANEDSFQSYIEYLKDPYKGMSTYMGKKIREECEHPTEKRNPYLLELYFDMTERLFYMAEKSINETCENNKGKCHLSKWWAEFRDRICNDLDISEELKVFGGNDTFEVEQFNKILLKELDKSKDKLIKAFNMDDMLSLILEPCTHHFIEDLLGCRDLCPFCKAPCDRNSSLSVDHRTEFHRPRGVVGVFSEKTNRLLTDICTTCVISPKARFKNSDTNYKWHFYKDYRTVNNVYRAWKIEPESGNSHRYWKWFMAKYNKELASYYKRKTANIPMKWRFIKQRSAIKDLKKTIKRLNRK